MSTTTTFCVQSTAANFADRRMPTLLPWLIELRTRQAEAHVRRHMMWVGDDTLRGWGLTPDQIESLRTNGRLASGMTPASRTSRPAAAVRHKLAVPLKNADRWIVCATKSSAELIATLVARRAERRLHRLEMRQLHSMSNRMLKDIGISRSQIDHAVMSGRDDIQE